SAGLRRDGESLPGAKGQVGRTESTTQRAGRRRRSSPCPGARSQNSGLSDGDEVGRRHGPGRRSAGALEGFPAKAGETVPVPGTVVRHRLTRSGNGVSEEGAVRAQRKEAGR